MTELTAERPDTAISVTALPQHCKLCGFEDAAVPVAICERCLGPLEPTYPRERLAFMLRDAGARLLVTQSSLRARLPPPADGRVASPMGACATRPRASTVKNETPARVAALMVARNCA